MKNPGIGGKKYSSWEDFKDFLILRIKENRIKQEKDEQKIIIKEVEQAVKGKEITLDNIMLQE